MFKLKNNDVNFVTMKWYINNLKDTIKLPNCEIQRECPEEPTEEVFNKTICRIIKHNSIGVIAITNDCILVDGYKRILAINSFIDGKIKYNGKSYLDFSEEEKKNFDNYMLEILKE